MHMMYFNLAEPLTVSCLACHDVCVAAISRRHKLPHDRRALLVELMQLCADACRTTAAAMVSSELEANTLARTCSYVCDACGHALEEVSDFGQCATACLDCGNVCRQYDRAAGHPHRSGMQTTDAVA